MTSLYQDLCRTVMQYCCEYHYVIYTHLDVVMMSRVHLYMYGSDGPAISIEHGFGCSIMQKPKTLL